MAGSPRPRMKLNNWSKIIQDWIYPPTCVFCGAKGGLGLDLCLDCLEALPRNAPACPRCALSLETNSPIPCGRCLSEPPSFDRILAPYRYQEPVRHLIRSLKFHADYPSARLIGQLMVRELDWSESGRPDCLIPVPLHPRRFRERGFNQALEIARVISSCWDIPVAVGSCSRQKPTAAQAALSAAERRRNVRRAFRVIRRPPGLHVALIDDVVTTGATVNELSKVLKKAGMERVDVWALARA